MWDDSQKVAGLREAWRSVGDFFRREPAKQRNAAADFLASEDPDRWQGFLAKVDNPEFVRQLGRVKDVDPKLVAHAQNLHAMKKAPVVHNIEGASGKKYDIKKMPGGSLSCTCRDWHFRGTVNPGYECKHIKAYKEGKEKIGMRFGSMMAAFNEELEGLADKQRAAKWEHKPDQETQRTPNTMLTQDEEAAYYNPRPAAGLDEPEVILGGVN